ncbi:ABC transporter permease [Mesorhizobium sp. 2RAF21]|uniref:ABC transporter permease n=1 Tax=Mesorhizobium sp. 2RAF21 TaxID=3232995 RepID=UPI003F9D0000
MRHLIKIWVMLGLAFLALPLLVIIPLSFTSGQYMVYTPEMVALDPSAYSTKWYLEVIHDRDWILALKNSLFIGVSAALLSTLFGTLAALGLSRAGTPMKGLWTALILMPQIVPIVVTAGGIYAAFSDLKLIGTYTGVIIAHTVLAAPVAVITIRASLERFDWDLVAASSTLGAGPLLTFRKVTLPLIRPAVIAGAIFSFATSLDEVVVIQFIGAYKQKTVPIQMLIGLREHLSPAILAVATMLVFFAVVILILSEVMRRRSDAYAQNTRKA